MSAYLRSWLSSALPTAQPSLPQSDVVITTSQDDDSDNDTVKGDNDDDDDDAPPAFPALNSAQRVGAAKKKDDSVPDILRADAKLMPPPPIPGLASRRPGVGSASSSSLGVLGSSSLGVPGSSLMPPPTTTQAPRKKSRKVELAPGYGPLDWGNLKKSGADLRVCLEYAVCCTDFTNLGAFTHCRV